MVEYSKVNVKLSDRQMKQLKTAVKNKTGTTLRVSLKMLDRIFKNLNDFHLFLCLKLLKVVVPEPCIFFWIPSLIAEAAANIPNGAKTFFAKGIHTFINGPANLLNNDPKNPADWNP